MRLGNASVSNPGYDIIPARRTRMLETANTPDTYPPWQSDLIASCEACGRAASIDPRRIPELPAPPRCTACGRRPADVHDSDRLYGGGQMQA